MKPRYKSNINYHSHNRNSNPTSNEESKTNEKNKKVEKVFFENTQTSNENSKNQVNISSKNLNPLLQNNTKNENENKQNNLSNNSHTGTASFLTNNSTITNSKGVKQIRRNRYNKTYTQIQKEKTEYTSKSNDEHSNNNNSNLNASRRTNNNPNHTNNNYVNNNNNNNSIYERKKFDHSKCGHFKTNSGADAHNCLKPSAKHQEGQGRKTLIDSRNGSIDFDIKNDFNRVITQHSNFADNCFNSQNHFYASHRNNLQNNADNKTAKANRNNNKRSSVNSNNNNKNSNGNKSKSMNQDELMNNLLKINLTCGLIAPHQNFNMSSSIKNLLTETNRLNNNELNNYSSANNKNNSNQHINSNNNKYFKSSDNITDKYKTLDSPKSMQEINYLQSPKINTAKNNIANKSLKNTLMAKSLSSIESDNNDNNIYPMNTSNNLQSYKSNLNTSKRSNLREFQIYSDYDLQRRHAKMAFSNENFYKQKNNNKSIGTVNLPTMNKTDPNAFKAIKNLNSNKNTISFDLPSYAEKGDLSQGNYFNSNKSFEKYSSNINNSNSNNNNNNINSFPPQIKSVKFYEAASAASSENAPGAAVSRSIEKIYDYPKRENNNISFFNTIASPNNASSSTANKLIMPNAKTMNSASPRQTAADYNKSTENNRINNNNNNNIQKINFQSEKEKQFALAEEDEKLHLVQSPSRAAEYSYVSPKNNKREASKQSDHAYNNPRINSNNYNSTEGDQLTLIEEADEKIVGHISEENINLNSKDVKKHSSDKSLHSKRKVDNSFVSKQQQRKVHLSDKACEVDSKSGNKIGEHIENNNSSFAFVNEKGRNSESKDKGNYERQATQSKEQLSSCEDLNFAENPLSEKNYKGIQESEFMRNAKTADNFYNNSQSMNNNNLLSNENSNPKISNPKKGQFSNKSKNNYSFDNRINSNLRSNSLKNDKNNTSKQSKNKITKNNKVAANTKETDKTQSGAEKSLMLINNEDPKSKNNTKNNNTTINNSNNLNKSNFANNLTEDSVYSKRNIVIERYLANKSANTEENNINNNNNNLNKANLTNVKFENPKKFINDQDDKISNFDNENINFSPNRYSRISISSFRESCDFELDKKFINSISNNEEFFSGEENKKPPSFSKKLVNPKLLLRTLKSQKSTLKISNANNNNNNSNNNKKSASKQKIISKNTNNKSLSEEKESNLKFNNNNNNNNFNNLKSLSNSFTNVLGNNSLLKSQIMERIETQSKQNPNISTLSKQQPNNSKNKPSPTKNKSSNSMLNNQSRSMSAQEQHHSAHKLISYLNPLNQSCEILANSKNANLQIGFQRLISKSTRGKNYFLKTENDELTSEYKNKKKSYKDYELEVVPINNIILNYKEDCSSEDDCFLEKFKKDLILPPNFNSRLKTIFNKSKKNKPPKKQKITSKIERRFAHSIGSFYNNSASNFVFNNSAMISPYSSFSNFSPRNNISNKLSEKILKFKEFQFFKTISPSNRHLTSGNSLSPKNIFNKNLNANFNSFDFNKFANEKLNYLQNKNSIRKAIEKYNKFNEIRNKFENINSPQAKDLNNKLFFSTGLSFNNKNNNLNNSQAESKNLKEIKKSLDLLNCEIENSNFTKSIKSPVNNSVHFRTEEDNLIYSPNKKLLGNLTFDHIIDFNFDRNAYNSNKSSTKNNFWNQNNFNFIYDISNSNNINYNKNTLNSLNSFSFHQSPKNNNHTVINNNNNNNNNTINNLNSSPYKIAHPNVLIYLPDPVSNNVELAEPFKNNIMTKLINKNNYSLNKSQFNSINNENETLLVQNTVNETLTNSLRQNQNLNIQTKKNNSNIQKTSAGNRSKSLGRSGKFMSEMLKKKFNFASSENSKSFNNNNNNKNFDNKDYNANEKSLSKSKLTEYSHDDILIEDESKFQKQFKELRENIIKIKSKNQVVKSPNTLNDPNLDLLNLKEKLKKNEIIPNGSNVNGKIKKLLEENKMLLLENLKIAAADSDILSINKNETFSKSRIKSKNSNFSSNLNHAKKLWHIRNKSKDLSGFDSISEIRNKSKLKNLDVLKNRNENIKNLVHSKIPYILSEDNIASTISNNLNKSSIKKSSNKKANLEQKINVYIDNKIEESKELKSARYTNEKKKEDLNKKFKEKLSNQAKSKKITSDEEYNNVLENLKHSDKAEFKEFILSKNKELEQDIQISDEKLSEFKDKFLKNFGREAERENINSFYKKLVTSGNHNNHNSNNGGKESGFANKPGNESGKLNEKFALYEKKPNIEEKIVSKNLEKLKSLLNLEERDSREMKFYNNSNSNSAKNYNAISNNNSAKSNFCYSNKNNSNTTVNSYKYDLLNNPISGFNNENKTKVNLGNSLKLAFHYNSSGNSVLPKNDLKLDDIKMKKICQNNNYKLNI